VQCCFCDAQCFCRAGEAAVAVQGIGDQCSFEGIDGLG
jgi:hypothetical protein